MYSWLCDRSREGWGNYHSQALWVAFVSQDGSFISLLNSETYIFFHCFRDWTFACEDGFFWAQIIQIALPSHVELWLGGWKVSNNIISISGVFCSLLCKIDKTSEFHYRLNFQWLVKKKTRKSGSIEANLIEPSVHHLVMCNATKFSRVVSVSQPLVSGNKVSGNLPVPCGISAQLPVTITLAFHCIFIGCSAS